VDTYDYETDAKIKIDVESIFEITKFIGDKFKIEHILYYLLENAVKFTKEGEIHLIIEKLKEERSRVEIKVTVSDTGIGIKKDILGNIFNAFYQGEYFLTKVYSGVGISLTIVKNICDEMNGSVDVSTAEGQGTTFHVILPLNLAENSN